MTTKSFTGWQYLLIDVANNAGIDLDKETFENRIAWAERNLTMLEFHNKGQVWKEMPLYLKAVQAVRKAQVGEASGHLVGLDAICSGMQIMSVLTGCMSGAKATGLVDPDLRADAYTECTTVMENMLGISIPGKRKDVKQAVMTLTK